MASFEGVNLKNTSLITLQKENVMKLILQDKLCMPMRLFGADFIEEKSKENKRLRELLKVLVICEKKMWNFLRPNYLALYVAN